MTYRNDPEGSRLPIKLDSTSTEEFAPIPLDASHHRANALATERAAQLAKYLGQGRRDFLVSACGAASTLLAFNAAHAAAGRSGGFFDLPKDAAVDREVAGASLDKKEFIFDVHGHFVNPYGEWLKKEPPGSTPLRFEKTSCPLSKEPGERSYLRCIGSDEFIKDVFLDSDTDLMVLTLVPSMRDREPLTIEEAVATRDIVERMEGSHRLLLHGRVSPNQPGDIEDMERLAKHGVVAWKTYTQYGPGGGYFMTDDAGIALVEQARKIGIKNICIHKGIPLGGPYKFSTCPDVGPIAKRFPDVNFLIYHSGYVPGKTEGPYDPAREDGIDGFVTSILKAGVKPNQNVYADLGSTWRFLVMRDPEQAAHGLGKLLKYVGVDNVLWGTDSIWFGSPQDQIQAFRTFQIAEELRDKHGYPQITPELRAKVFGLNALRIYPVPKDVVKKHLGRDAVAMARANYSEHPDPTFATHGPKTRREFLTLKRRSDGHS